MQQYLQPNQTYVFLIQQYNNMVAMLSIKREETESGKSRYKVHWIFFKLLNAMSAFSS